MKYIDADLLREKIAEQTKSLPREVGRGAGTITTRGYGMMQAFQIMRSIIDSLQQEQDLIVINKKDWEAQERFRKNKHFGKPFQQEQLEEPVKDKLDKELDRFIASGKSVTIDDYGTYKVSYHDFKKVARHFAEWQKEQMLKGAVEGFIFQPADYYPKELIAHYAGELGMGDKVRIIILPKED